MEKKKLGRQICFYGGVFLVGILFIFHFWTSPLEVETLDIKFEVGNSLGITSSSGLLDFGRILPGMTVSKVVTLESDYTFPIRIDILISQDLLDFVFSESSRVVFPGESVIIPVELRVPEEALGGEYSGQIRFELEEIKE